MTKWADRSRTLVLLMALAGVGLSAGWLERRNDGIGKAAVALRAAGLNLEAREEQTAGYYEGLLDEGERVSRMNPRMGSGAGAPDWRTGLVAVERRGRNDFLVYDLKPNLRVGLSVTNSEGLVDREYPRERVLGVRRIALVGDSVTRGQGVAFGSSFEARLEEDLAQHLGCSDQPPPEIINFAVGGYKITQLLDVIPTRARAFRPDVYVVALTELSVSRLWPEHLTTLIRQEQDLKYPFLVKMVRDSRVSPTDPQQTMRAKLSRFRFDVIRETILEMKRMASADRAELLVLLVPSGRPVREMKEQFQGVPELLASGDVDVVDLTDTFANVTDISTIRVSEEDAHPNTAGHAMLFRALRAQIDTSNTRARDIFLGASCSRRLS